MIHMDTHRYTQTHTDTHVCTRVHTDTLRRIRTHTYAHEYTQIHTDTVHQMQAGDPNPWCSMSIVELSFRSPSTGEKKRPKKRTKRRTPLPLPRTIEFVRSQRYQSLLQDHHQVLVLFIFSVLHTTRTRSANPPPLWEKNHTPSP